MKLRILTKNIIIIAVILTVVFLSQQPSFARYGGDLYALGTQKAGQYWLEGKDWFKTAIYPGANRGVENGKDIIEKEIVKQKDVAAKNIWEKFKNYFAEKFSKMSGTKVE